MAGAWNSRKTRVLPVFGWLKENGGEYWPARLVALADGVEKLTDPGEIVAVHLKQERTVPATGKRLIWMLENASSLAPRDGKEWRELVRRTEDPEAVRRGIEFLKAGKSPGKRLILEGRTSADCLIECERALIWIEGKRFDWIDPATKWDVSRDQLARNVEAASFLAFEAEKEYRVLICHEYPLKHHEVVLLEGYRASTWSAGWPHVPVGERQEFAKRIGTLTWSEVTREWPCLPIFDGDSRLQEVDPMLPAWRPQAAI